MTRENARRIAAEVASGFDADLEILGPIPTRGGSSYVELLVLDTRCDPDACRVLIGADRSDSETAFRRSLRERLQKFKKDGRA